MSRRLRIEIGRWLHDPDRDVTFRVVALDDRYGMIAVQHLDGELEELDLDDVRDMTLEPASGPDDWRAPFGLEEDGDEEWSGEFAEYESQHLRIVEHV